MNRSLMIYQYCIQPYYHALRGRIQTVKMRSRLIASQPNIVYQPAASNPVALALGREAALLLRRTGWRGNVGV